MMVAPERRRLRFRVPVRSLALLVIVIVGGGAYALLRGDGPAFLGALTRIPPGTWLSVAGLALISYGLRAVRWMGMLGHMGYSLPRGAGMTVYIAGFALTLTPAKAGETIRAMYLLPWGVPVGASVAAFVAERLMDLVAVTGLSVLAGWGGQGFTWAVPVVAAGGAAILMLVRSRLLPDVVGRIMGRAAGDALIQAVGPLHALLRLQVWMRWVGPTLLAWGAQGVAFHLVVTGLGHAGPLPGLVGLYCLAILLGALSFMPGGLGATEAALVILLEQHGLGVADAVAAGLVTRGLTLWLAVLLGSLATARLAVVRSQASEG